MSDRALELLADQPGAWPRWSRGYVYGETVGRKSRRMDGMVATKERHLFIFEPVDFANAGVASAACSWTDDTDRVFYDNERRLTRDPADPLCPHCQEIELQHGLRREETV